MRHSEQDRRNQMMAEEFQIVHFIPGRIRMKIDQLKGDVLLAENIQQTLSALSGINEVKVNHITGSVLVLYDPGMTESIYSILDMAEALGFLPEGAENLKQQICSYIAGDGSQISMTDGLKALFGHMNAQIANLTNRAVDLKALIPLSLFFLGLRSLIFTEQRPIPTWYDFFWFSFSTFFVLNPPNRS
jgi:hypothetical protein